MPLARFTVEGEIKEFTQIDNLYRTLRREGSKLLRDWKITFDVNYTEKEGELEIPGQS